VNLYAKHENNTKGIAYNISQGGILKLKLMSFKGLWYNARTMPRQEQLRVTRPDAQAKQAKEPELPTSEVREPALQLIRDFMEVIKRTPEFQQTLQDLPLTEAQRADIWNEDDPYQDAIIFGKGDYSYQVKHSQFRSFLEDDKDRYTKVFDATKYSKRQGDFSYDSVNIKAAPPPNPDSLNIVGGMIIHIKDDDRRDVFGGNKIYVSSNKPSTIQEVKDFLTTNFGKPQSQTQAQQ
jgi:hypothetical protein